MIMVKESDQLSDNPSRNIVPFRGPFWLYIKFWHSGHDGVSLVRSTREEDFYEKVMVKEIKCSLILHVVMVSLIMNLEPKPMAYLASHGSELLGVRLWKARFVGMLGHLGPVPSQRKFSWHVQLAWQSDLNWTCTCAWVYWGCFCGLFLLGHCLGCFCLNETEDGFTMALAFTAVEASLGAWQPFCTKMLLSMVVTA